MTKQTELHGKIDKPARSGQQWLIRLDSPYQGRQYGVLESGDGVVGIQALRKRHGGCLKEGHDVVVRRFSIHSPEAITVHEVA